MLALSGLTRRFGDVLALDGLTFAVEPGQVFGFVGSNGAGKTTAMRIVMGLLRADEGEVRWRGEAPEREQRRRFGYMPEERGLYPRMRVGQQLVYLGRLHGMSATDAQSSATGWLERFGLGDRRTERLEKLSLGNQQRVQLAAALIHAPDLLILDEPFSGLDPVGVDEMSVVLAEYAGRGVPVLFSSHQLDLVERLCDAVAIIDAGRLVAGGPVGQLVREGGARQRRIQVTVATPDAGTTAATVVQGLGAVEVLRESREAEGLTILVRVSEGASVDAVGREVLEAAGRAGTVRSFTQVKPQLSELYRQVVSR